MEQPTRPLTVLLVDDEPRFREILAKRLRHRGVSVEEAPGGEEALESMRREAKEVVVLDVKMPGLDGIETLRRLKTAHPECEVILLTGHASPQDGVEGIKAGAFDYLSKPVEFEHLLRKITQARNKIERLRAERREAEFREQIRRQMAVAERLAALGTLASGVAHEINNPLAVIQDSAGWLQQILEKPETADMPRREDFAQALARIQRAVGRARTITRQLLQAVHNPAGDSLETVHLREVSLPAIAEEALALVRREAADRGLALALEASDPPPLAWTDPALLLQVILNLLNNALQATDSGGRVTLRLGVKGEHAVLAVEDTGRGIPPEHLNRIFEPFFTTKEVGRGTGMGLYVSWAIMNRLQGGITVESREGRGATFTLTLPRKPPPTA